ncbi:Uncharacterised protein [BD1-7 clade bacterium]|uniref:DUF1318 domain-containing protein n=1 Tax=BD1-7 clade bacterium TaxID=2029982 RepID=A0A5S9MRS3_9GAMM|nr:Uncharacterised protein [BD1-7 clade bacterium]
MMKLLNLYRRIVLVAVLFVGGVSAAYALDLDQAKADGLVGETPSGYLKAVKASNEINALVTSINNKRMAQYKKVAMQNGLTLSQVEKLAGEKAIKRTRSGNYILRDGAWEVK